MATDAEKKDQAVFHRDTFYRFLDGEITAKEAKILCRKKKGTGDWTDTSYNIIGRKPCPNGCKYCYVTPMRIRFGQMEKEELDDIEDIFEIHEKRVNKGWAKPKKGPRLYMFPSTHDIFPEMVDDYISVCKKILSVGHELLITSKPRIECIKKICRELKEYKSHVEFMITIGSNDDDIIRQFEDRTPLYAERLRVLKFIYKQNYRVSVSMEPMLSDPTEFIDEIEPYVNGRVWIGLMNHIYRSPRLEPDDIDHIEELNDPDNVERIVWALRDHEKVFWKDSIPKLMFASFSGFA